MADTSSDESRNSSMLEVVIEETTTSSTTAASTLVEPGTSAAVSTDSPFKIPGLRAEEKNEKSDKDYHDKSVDDSTSLLSGTLEWVKTASTENLGESTKPEHSYEVEGMSIKQLPWTEDDTLHIMEQIRFLQNELPGGRGLNNSHSTKLWKESLDNLKHKIQAAVSDGSMARDDPSLEKLRSAMAAIHLVDMRKLNNLMKANQMAGDCIAGKDVILLCGETGAGKTTTLQYLVGTSFEEVEVDGFLHLNPTSYVDPTHKKFKTSYSREPTTRVLQAATEWVDGHGEIAICDVPSYDVANCLEEDIALGMGMVQAICRAKSVRPVLVLSREGMGNRFSNLPESMRIVRRLCNVESKEDWKPFTYAFTKYDLKHRKLLHKQFTALKRMPPKLGKGQAELFDALVSDIAKKTSPDAHVILPMDEHPAKPLGLFFQAEKANPKLLCTTFASEFAIRQLQLQMQLQMHNFHARLLQEDYRGAIKLINGMIDMSGFFPEMETFIRLAKEHLTQQVAQLWVLVIRSISKEDYHTALYRIEQLNVMAKDFPDAVECSALGHQLLIESITKPLSEDDLETSIHRVTLLNKLRNRFPEASDTVEVGLQALQEKLITLFELREFKTGIDLLQMLNSDDFNTKAATDAVEGGIAALTVQIVALIKEREFKTAVNHMQMLKSDEFNTCAASEAVEAGIRALTGQIVALINEREFKKAGDLVHILRSDEFNTQAASEAVEAAVQALSGQIEALIKEREFKRAVDLMRMLKSDEYNTQATSGAMEAGIQALGQQVCTLIQEKEFNTAIDLMQTIKSDGFNTPGSSDAVESGIQALRARMITLIQEKDFDVAIDLIHLLGQAESEIPNIFSVAQHGLHLVRECMLQLVEEEDYADGIRLTIKISDLGRDFAEANAYVRRILKMIRKRIDQAIQTKEYVKAGYLLRIISDLAPSLHDGKEYVECALDNAAQHVCELRMEVVNAFDMLLQVKDQSKYRQLLEFASTAMSNLNKSEPTRIVCAQYYKNQQVVPQDTDLYKPNYLAILCTPRDCTSESFCIAQVRHLIECMAAELSAFDNEEITTVEYLMERRKQLLSLILRLRGVSNIFKDSSGGSMAIALYEKGFVKFQQLIENILSKSETSFDSSMNMKEFEFQAWLLAFLIQGFTREREEEDGPDIQKVEDLDHRRVTLMLRFENEISDTMELLTNYKFPDFLNAGKDKPNLTAFFQEVNLSDLEAPRQLLLSLSQAPQLCKMMATMLCAQNAQNSVVALDKAVLEIFVRIVSYLESYYTKLVQGLKSKKLSSHVGLEDAAGLSQDTAVLRLQMDKVRSWSDEMEKGIEPLQARLNEIEACLRGLTPKLKERAHGADDISPVSFISTLISGGGNDSENSGPMLGCACIGSACQAPDDDFFASLPMLLSGQKPSLLKVAKDNGNNTNKGWNLPQNDLLEEEKAGQRAWEHRKAPATTPVTELGDLLQQTSITSVELLQDYLD